MVLSDLYLPLVDFGQGIPLLLKGKICKLLTFASTTTYLPRLVKVVCERHPIVFAFSFIPRRLINISSAQYRVDFHSMYRITHGLRTPNDSFGQKFTPQTNPWKPWNQDQTGNLWYPEQVEDTNTEVGNVTTDQEEEQN